MPFPAHLMTDTIIVSKFLSTDDTDAFGTAQYGPKTKMLVALDIGFFKVKDSEGNERSATHAVVSPVPIEEDDRVWVPKVLGEVPSAADDNDARNPISVRSGRSRASGFFLNQSFF